MPAVEKLLKECGVKPKELTKIVVVLDMDPIQVFA